jgi:hypothetical protein
MKIHALLAILQFGGGWVLYPPLADAQQAVTDEPSPALRSCIATNAPGVERVFDSLNEGVDFLVQKICLSEITDQLVERNKRQAAEQKARMDQMCRDAAARPAPPANPKPDDPLPDFDNARFLRQMCQQQNSPMNVLGNPLAGDMSYLFMGPDGMRAPKAEALAAQTLLKLRVDKLPKSRQ